MAFLEAETKCGAQHHTVSVCLRCRPSLTAADGGRRVVYGTDDGVYLSDLREPNQEPVKVLALLEVTQVDVLEDYQLLIVLSGAYFAFFFFFTLSKPRLLQSVKLSRSLWKPWIHLILWLA